MSYYQWYNGLQPVQSPVAANWYNERPLSSSTFSIRRHNDITHTQLTTNLAKLFDLKWRAGDFQNDDTFRHQSAFEDSPFGISSIDRDVLTNLEAMFVNLFTNEFFQAFYIGYDNSFIKFESEFDNIIWHTDGNDPSLATFIVSLSREWKPSTVYNPLIDPNGNCGRLYDPATEEYSYGLMQFGDVVVHTRDVCHRSPSVYNYGERDIVQVSVIRRPGYAPDVTTIDLLRQMSLNASLANGYSQEFLVPSNMHRYE